MNVAATQLPLHDAGNTFVRALSQTSHVSLFSAGEKKILAALCVIAFALPLTISGILLKQQSQITSLSLGADQIAHLTPASLSAGSDDLAMAEIFINKANESLSDPGVSAQYLSQAQSLISLTTQTGARLEELKNQLASALGSTSNDSISVQRIAAPASTTAASIDAETTSNAKSQSVTMKTGVQELFVPYEQLANDTQIYITIENNRDNAVVYVSKREENKGFTLATVAPLRQDLLVTWYEIKSQ